MMRDGGGDIGLLAIDQGTTSSRAILFDTGGCALITKQKELKLYHPHKGWVEQDVADIWEDTLWACKGIEAEAKGLGVEIAGVGITNQRETTIIWDRVTGEPVYNAIVWQDRRTAELCAELKEAGHEAMVSERTGLLLDPYFSATKIAWILDNVEGVRARAEAGELAFGTVDCYLLWKLTEGEEAGGAVHATDATNASRTMIFNVLTQDWDDELLELFNIPRSLLPQVIDNIADFGLTSVLSHPYKIGGMAGDQQAALIGQGCFDKGMVKSTYGTGCFALMNIGGEFRVSEQRLLTTVAYRLDGEVSYALEGSIFMAGATIQWLRDQLGVIEDAAQSEELALSVEDNNGVYIVPAFTGLGAPYWEPEAKAIITGLSRESSKAHIVRAALEAQGYQSYDLMGAMEADSGASVDVLRVDGGLVANEFVCQFLADMLDVRVEVPKVTESTAWGAACLAGVSVGVFKSLADVVGGKHWCAHKTYKPQMDKETRAKLYKGWARAVEQVLVSVHE